MNRFFMTAVAVVSAVGLLVVRLGMDPQAGQAQQATAVERGGNAFLLNTPAPRPSATAWIPTVDYQSTLDVAQQAAYRAQSTADAAMRLQVEATAAQEQRWHEERMAAAEQTRMAQELELQSLYGTQTAAPTANAATATQQAWVIEQSHQQATMLADMYTATVQAPQLIKAAKAAEYYEYTLIAQGVAFLGVGVFGFGLLAFVIIKWRNETRRLEEEEEREAAQAWGPQVEAGEMGIGITFRKGGRDWRDVAPCTRGMLVELADGLQTGKTLAINHWEGAETVWTRDTFLPFRAWLVRNELAVYDNKMLRLTQDGEGMEGMKFMQFVSARSDVPPFWVFGQTLAQILGDSDHMSLSHDGGGGAGEGWSIELSESEMRG